MCRRPVASLLRLLYLFYFLSLLYIIFLKGEIWKHKALPSSTKSSRS